MNLENNQFISEYVDEDYENNDQISPGRKRLINYYQKDLYVAMTPCNQKILVNTEVD